MTGENEAVNGAALVETLQLEDPQVQGPLAVFPLRLAENGGPRYVTLRQAIAGGQAAVTEVSEGGSVPELRVVNKGERRVLVLDGEELRGAKQNRVLNTSILVGGHSSLVVPVSCTEQGRWSYASREFDESEVVADRQVRFAMRESVNANLASGVGHRSDQGRVWSEVSALHGRHATSSPTGAMRDAYQSRKGDLDTLLAAFPLLDGQQGVLVLHGARVVGLDLVSRAPQYAELHEKLLRSYAFEALVAGGEPGDRAVAGAFLERISGLHGRRFKSPGLGWDVRFEGAGVLGSALTYRGHAVHAAFFDVGGVTAGSESGRSGTQSPRPRPDWRIADARERARRRQTR
jgi:hypothetical protein